MTSMDSTTTDTEGYTDSDIYCEMIPIHRMLEERQANSQELQPPKHVLGQGELWLETGQADGGAFWPGSMYKEGDCSLVYDETMFTVADYQDMSMATNASYLPGVSLADKLRLAASKGQIEKVRELVQTGSSFEPDREGRTALHYAALNGYGDVVKFLADQNCDIDAQDNLGYTALHRAAAQGHLEVIRVLLDEGCALDRQDEVHGNAALHEAAWNGYSKTLEVLAKGRANPHVSNKAGFTALHLAAQNGHNQSARVLLYASCNADRKNNYGDTALHTAVRYGHAGVTRILISARCNINEQNKNGDTSLHIAAALKRRKIAKLLTEAGIDVNVRNKQNETAVDVARRKEHPEIIVLITSQPKVKKKKRFGRNKSGDKSDPRQSLDSAEDDKKPEKRGFFFKKKAKTKEKPSSTAAATTASAGVEARPHFDQSMPPEQLLEGFRQHQHMQRGGAPGHAPSKDSLAGPSTSLAQGGAQARGAGPGPKGKRVHGLLNQYVPKNGTQYYRDLAGNVKQGPIGYAPICNCAPLLKKLEQRVEADQANMYDHVQATHKTLVDRMDSVEKRTAQQVYALDKLVKERLDAERREHDKYINSRTVRERIETERQLEHNQDVVRTELKSWVDHRISNIEQKYLPHKNGCDWNHRHGRRYAQCDDMLNRGFNGVHGMETPLPGRLYRSKSDETLSSCNPSKRHFKMRARTMEEIKKLNLPSVANRANKFERKLRSQRQHGEPLSVVVEGKHGSGQFSPVGSGRSPEGKSVHGDFTEYGPIEGGEHAQRMVFEMSDQMSRLGVLDEDQQRSLSDSYAHMLSQSEPDIEGRVRRSLPSQCYTSNPTYTDCQARLTSTPNEVAIHHSKQDSGSNPDSGYGSKIYGNRPGSAKSNSSPISNSQDAHNSSILTNTSDGSSIHSPATFIPGENNPDCLHVTRHFFDTVSTEMEKWYERRLRDVERKAEERVRQEADVMQSRLKALEKRFAGTTATDV